MRDTNTGGPAFPCEWDYINSNREAANGMTLRQYAAIKLKVPDSGTDWLDDMIRKSLRDYFAAKWLQGFMANPAVDDLTPDLAACKAYQIADAMLKARQA